MEQFQDAREIENAVKFHKQLTKLIEETTSEFNRNNVNQQSELYEHLTELREIRQNKGNPRSLQTLSGPIQFTFYRNIDGRRILLLGEVHSNSTLCSNPETSYSVTEWLYALAETSYDCLDIFCEAFSADKMKKEKYFNFYKAYQYLLPESNKKKEEQKVIERYYMQALSKNDPKTYKSQMQHVRQVFENCNMSIGDRVCPISGLRYHLIDARLHIDKNKSLPAVEILDFGHVLAADEGLRTRFFIFINEYHYNIYRYHCGFVRDKAHKAIYEDFLKFFDPKLQRQIKNFLPRYFENFDKQVKNVNFGERGFSFFQECLYEAQMNCDLISRRKKIGVNDGSLNSMPGEEMQACTFFLYVFMTVQMDVYFLLRWMRTYNSNKHPVEGCPYDVAMNSIFYGGGAHTLTYNEFIKLYYGVLPDIHIFHANYDQCMILPRNFDFFA